MSLRTLCPLLLVVLWACGSARVVHTTERGGELALDGDSRKARKHAHRLMREHCRGAYEIDEDGEVVIVAEPPQDEPVPGAAAEESETGATEWRIRFTCRPDDPEPAGPSRSH